MRIEDQTSFDKFRYWLKANLYIGVGKSLFLWFLGISFIPLLTLSFVNYLVAYAGVQSVAEKSLMASSQLRIEYLKSYFSEVSGFVKTQALLSQTINFLDELVKAKEQSATGASGFVNSTRWKDISSGEEGNFAALINGFGYYDIILADPTGDILFNLKDKPNLGENIVSGPFAGTGLSKTAKAIFEGSGILFTDFGFYPSYPSGPSGFIAGPVKGPNNEVLGLIAVQITPEKINNIVQDDVGIGSSGISYIVGEDLKLRTSTRNEDLTVVLNKKADSKKTQEWKKYIINRDDWQYITNNNLDKEKISIYYSLYDSYVLGVYRHLQFMEPLGVNWALLEEIDQGEAYAYARQLSDIAKISFVLTILVVFFISVVVTRKFVMPIKKLSAWTKLVQEGVLDSQKIKAPKNEVGEMVDTFNDLVTTLRSYAEVSESAAIGDYSKSVMIRSKYDVLGKSMNQMIESFKNVVSQANTIAKGDYSAEVVPRSDKDTLGIALYKMTTTLRETSREVREQDWMKTGISRLEGKLSGLKDIHIMTGEIISFLAEYIEVTVGLLYVADNQKLVLTASYAFKDRFSRLNEIEFGEGLTGQAVLDKKTLVVNEPNENIPETNTGIDTKKPTYSIISPLIFENEAIGALVLGAFSSFSKLKLEFINRCTERIAIAINTVQSHSRVEKLLEQTTEQTNALQVQQEELRQANEELEEQTKALRLSEENLKSQQEELRVINEELEERTNDLQLERDNIRKKNDELKLAQEEIQKKARDLEQASKYKSEFLANMSHELRTPLNSILVLSQLLSENKKDHLDPKETEYAKTINSSGKDLLELINDILDLSKVESGKMDVYIEEVYLNEIADYVRKTFEPLTNKKGLELIIEIDKDLPDVIKTDYQKVLQILKNLISNAIKFTGKGSITLSISKPGKETSFSVSRLNPDDTLAFTVTDTGIGITENKLNAIFEAFQQADGTTSRRFGGTGLGLTISKSFSTLLGGEIQVKSKENSGSVFTLFIPLEYHEDKQLEPKQDRTGFALNESNIFGITTEEKKTKRKTEGDKDPYEEINDDIENLGPGETSILIIEDDVNFCNVLSDLSHEQGFKCLIALDGERGLYYADIYNPDAIILDIGLPGIDGYEVMKRLKDNPETRHIPIHIISASDKSLEALKMGAIGYLTKPVSNEKLSEVFKKIENIISRPIKRALIVEDDRIMRKSLINLLDVGNVEITAVESGEEAYEVLNKDKYECMILDLGLKELSGFELLEKVRKDKKLKDLPVIIYTGQDLSPEENEKLQKYADSIILKGARSFERLLSEASLFLHQVQKDLPNDKQQILKSFQSKTDVLTNKKILIVDDDMRNVFALSSVLENNQMQVVIARNGLEGINKLKEYPDIDLVLMDIMMPEMNGYEAMQEIRKDMKFRKLPIIALTAKAMKEDRARCIASGANDYMAKPVNTDKLLSLLRVWLYSK